MLQAMKKNLYLCWNLDLWGAAMPPEAGAYWWQPLEAHGAYW